MDNKRKTRHLSIYELFEILQQEYIVCDLRSKIYPYKNHKEYWKDIAEKKKEKIIDIASRNGLPHIFNDKNILEFTKKKIIGDSGYPNFLYRDDKQKERQEKWDIINYYSKGSNIKVEKDGKIDIGIVVKVNQENKEVEIDFNGKIKLIPFSQATRIL